MALTPRHRPARTRSVIAAALLALLLAQFGALWHAVVHGPVVLAGHHHAAPGADDHGGSGSPCTEAHAALPGTPAGFGSPLALLPHSHDTADHADHADHTGPTGPTGHEAGTPQCQLFDHLLQEQAGTAAGLPGASAAWARAAPPAPATPAPPSAAAQAYDARGPPTA